MTVFSAAHAFFFRSSNSVASEAIEKQPWFIVAMVVVVALNVAYYWLKAKGVDRGVWRRFWFIGALAMGTCAYAPEIFSLQLPDPLWKVVAIPVGAALVSFFLVAVNPSSPPPQKDR
jgi:hypothetical protein